MSSLPERLRSSTTRILRDHGSVVASIEIEQLEALPYTMDGKPITAELRAAKDAGFRKGWDKGWADGHEQGMSLGRDTAYKEFTDVLLPTLRAINEALEQVRRADELVLEELVQRSIAFGYQIAEAIIGRELVATDTAALDAVRRAIALVPERGDVTIRLNPADLNIVRAVDAVLPGREVELIADANVERGGAVVYVGSCHIDAQLQPALARVRESLGL
jgi:flagellar assembly protein FliH